MLCARVRAGALPPAPRAWSRSPAPNSAPREPPAGRPPGPSCTLLNGCAPGTGWHQPAPARSRVCSSKCEQAQGRTEARLAQVPRWARMNHPLHRPPRPPWPVQHLRGWTWPCPSAPGPPHLHDAVHALLGQGRRCPEAVVVARQGVQGRVGVAARGARCRRRAQGRRWLSANVRDPWVKSPTNFPAHSRAAPWVGIRVSPGNHVADSLPMAQSGTQTRCATPLGRVPCLC